MANRFPLLVPVLLAIASIASDAGAAQQYYVDASQVDLQQILAPPPLPDSAASKADLATVLELQRKRTQAEVRSAQADQELSVFRFADAIGPGFRPENLSLTTRSFFQHVSSDNAQIVAAAKTYFHRPRPFIENLDVSPVLGRPTDPSYPSGHATFAYVDAIVLAVMVPEKAAAIFDRAAEYAHNRVVGGVHYPSDIEAGRIAGSVIDNVLLHEPRFSADLERARADVRHAIGLQSMSTTANGK